MGDFVSMFLYFASFWNWESRSTWSVKLCSLGQSNFFNFQNRRFKTHMNKHVFPEFNVFENERNCWLFTTVIQKFSFFKERIQFARREVSWRKSALPDLFPNYKSGNDPEPGNSYVSREAIHDIAKCQEVECDARDNSNGSKWWRSCHYVCFWWITDWKFCWGCVDE